MRWRACLLQANQFKHSPHSIDSLRFKISKCSLLRPYVSSLFVTPCRFRRRIHARALERVQACLLQANQFKHSPHSTHLLRLSTRADSLLRPYVSSLFVTFCRLRRRTHARAIERVKACSLQAHQFKHSPHSIYLLRLSTRTDSLLRPYVFSLFVTHCRLRRRTYARAIERVKACSLQAFQFKHSPHSIDSLRFKISKCSLLRPYVSSLFVTPCRLRRRIHARALERVKAC